MTRLNTEMTFHLSNNGANMLDETAHIGVFCMTDKDEAHSLGPGFDD